MNNCQKQLLLKLIDTYRLNIGNRADLRCDSDRD